MEYTIGTKVFGEWEIVKVLGEGANGKVFEIHKTEFGVTARSALKVIRVPRSASEVQTAISEGMDELSATSYFREMVDEIVKEIALMTELKNHPNIVSYEDHSVIEHEDEIGWDVLIRMELLTGLNGYSASHVLEEADVLRLGKDICSALIFCQKKGMIHRDIKPENIFVSEIGQFKLGDFGVARTIEKTSSGLSRKGTLSYMPPEVYLGKPYGESVDIYSLGLVLYKYRNDGRLPFFPPASQPLTFAARERAMERRMSGEQIPAPSQASRELAQIILKACAFQPQMRYHTAAEMMKALDRVRPAAMETTSDQPLDKTEDMLRSGTEILPETADMLRKMSMGQTNSGTGQTNSRTGQTNSGTGQMNSGTGQMNSGTGQMNSGTDLSEKVSADQTDRKAPQKQKALWLLIPVWMGMVICAALLVFYFRNHTPVFLAGNTSVTEESPVHTEEEKTEAKTETAAVKEPESETTKATEPQSETAAEEEAQPEPETTKATEPQGKIMVVTETKPGPETAKATEQQTNGKPELCSCESMDANALTHAWDCRAFQEEMLSYCDCGLSSESDILRHGYECAGALKAYEAICSGDCEAYRAPAFYHWDCEVLARIKSILCDCSTPGVSYSAHSESCGFYQYMAAAGEYFYNQNILNYDLPASGISIVDVDGFSVLPDHFEEEGYAPVAFQAGTSSISYFTAEDVSVSRTDSGRVYMYPQNDGAKGKFGARYKKVLYYNDEWYDLKITVCDYGDLTYVNTDAPHQSETLYSNTPVTFSEDAISFNFNGRMGEMILKMEFVRTETDEAVPVNARFRLWDCDSAQCFGIRLEDGAIAARYYSAEGTALNYRTGKVANDEHDYEILIPFGEALDTTDPRGSILFELEQCSTYYFAAAFHDHLEESNHYRSTQNSIHKWNKRLADGEIFGDELGEGTGGFVQTGE